MSDPREAELLRALQARDEELARVNKELAAAQKEITRLRESLDALSRRLFGKKSEQLDPIQLELLLRLSGNELEKPTPPLKRRWRSYYRLPSLPCHARARRVRRVCRRTCPSSRRRSCLLRFRRPPRHIAGLEKRSVSRSTTSRAASFAGG